MKRKIWIPITVVLILSMGVLAFFYLAMSKTHSKLTVEAGSVLEPKDFAAKEVKEISFADGTDSFNADKLGVFEVKVKADGFTRNCKVIVQDTTAPYGEAKETVVMPGEICEAKDMVCNVSDATTVRASFVSEPDFNTCGLQNVDIELMDEGGNKSIVFATLLVSKVDTLNAYEWEAGDKVPEASFFLKDKGDCEYAPGGTDSVNFHHLGEYPVNLKVDGIDMTVTLKVVDTTAPKVVGKNCTAALNFGTEPKAFIDEATDATALTYEFGEEPDWSIEGEVPVTVIVTDEGGNKTEVKVTAFLEADTEAPVFMGVGDLSVTLGETVSYRSGVSCIDNCDGEVEYTIDNSLVDLSVVGVYPVVYSAKDVSGNESKVTVSVTVMEKKEGNVTIDDVYALADAALADIITEDMTQYEQAQAIFNWVRAHVGWTDHTEKDDWITNAYEGFTNHRGDCYTYASVSKALLTRAGIPNVDCRRESTRSFHIWNLVNCGDGWYHFDATPRTDKEVIFMWSENELNANEGVRKTHVYDHSLYPEVNAD